jgi:hypothetical protein
LREIGVILDGVAQRLKREHNDRAWAAWHTAALHRQKKMPPLNTLTHAASPRRRRRQSWQEQLAMAEAWTAAINRMDRR